MVRKHSCVIHSEPSMGTRTLGCIVSQMRCPCLDCVAAMLTHLWGATDGWTETCLIDISKSITIRAPLTSHIMPWERYCDLCPSRYVVRLQTNPGTNQTRTSSSFNCLTAIGGSGSARVSMVELSVATQSITGHSQFKRSQCRCTISRNIDFT